MAANTGINITELDFNNIKTSLKNFLKSQDTLKDYNYEGAALSNLLDLLSYNTQYNAYYLNMVANEMFLDSALQRDSVVSQAKLLGYVPKSARAPSATITLKVNQVTDTSLTLPKFTNFISESVDGVNYNFVTTESSTVNVTSNTATFSNITIKQGLPTAINYTVTDVTTKFRIPDVNVDTSSLVVTVRESTSNNYTTVYSQATDFLNLDSTSQVYFLQEGIGGFYEIYFGDDILGKKLNIGNVVNISYIITQGTSAFGANNFVLMDSIGGYSNTTIYPITPTNSGSEKETIDSIKYQAPKNYSSQGRAVTKEDYITAIQQNSLGYSFDAVNVWGGEENDPPVYGQVFVCIKPSGGYTLTQTQKQNLVIDVIKPLSVMTVEPTIVDPDYTYLQLTANVLYDPKKTTLTSGQLQSAIKTAIANYSQTALNDFNSTFSATDFTDVVRAVDSCIITNEISVKVQKKFFPNLTTPTTYKLYYGTPLEKGMFQSGIYSSPSCKFLNPINTADIVEGIYIEEVPSSTGGVESISVTNPGFGYQYAPTVTIKGDGTGATATAVINSNGTVKEIKVTNAGSGYTSAIVTLTPQANDTTGQQAAGIVQLQGRYGTLRLYYNNTENVKTVFNNNIGTVDYVNGIVTLNSFGPVNVDNDLGRLSVTANPTTTIISSTYNRIITLDPYDPSSIVVNVIAKT